ncbi:MAG TPA: hypothetical protein VEU50_11030 [Archangium sp.]|nr:hypothetical protein [Archangium sp.]HYO53305.1 hypothetical protein [Archangium sp.]
MALIARSFLTASVVQPLHEILEAVGDGVDGSLYRDEHDAGLLEGAPEVKAEVLATRSITKRIDTLWHKRAEEPVDVSD